MQEANDILTETAPLPRECGGGARRIGLFGGSFNPVHLGHLIMAQDAVQAGDLDELWFIPCGAPPHKEVRDLAPTEHRLAMLTRAISGDARFACCEIELRRTGPSYSVDTVRELTARHEGVDFFFLIGSDSLFDLHGWREAAELIRRCGWIVVARPGFDARALSPESLRLPPDLAARVTQCVVAGHPVGISSSDIRMRIAEGLDVKYLVPPAVERYIDEQRLYR
jgi:nicotinate-nucleotide adenylyltransferase